MLFLIKPERGMMAVILVLILTDLFLSGFHAAALLGICISIVTLILPWAVPNIIFLQNTITMEQEVIE